MSMPRQTAIALGLDIVGNVSAQPLTQVKNSRTFGSSGVELGGRIILGTATSVKVLITDADGKVLHDNTSAITASKTIDPIPAGVRCPISVTTTEISNAAHTLRVVWSVKK